MNQVRRRTLIHATSMAGGVAAAFLTVAVLGGDTFPRSQPAPPPGYMTARGEGYTLYAPDPAALREGVAEIEFARQSFRRDFRAEPGKVVVVLADSPAAFRGIDLDALRRRGAAFLPFVTRRSVAWRESEESLITLDGGVLLEYVDGVPRVMASGRGGARAAGLAVGDEVVSLAGVSGTAREPLVRAFEAIPLGNPVRLEVRRDGRVLPIGYRKGPEIEGAARAHLAAAARFRAESKTLAHEVCHQLVASHATHVLRGRASPSRGYGHPALPDWADEMAATLCESPALLERRRTYLRANLRERIPLAQLARMEHPVSVAVRTRAAGSPLPDTLGGSPVIILRGEEARELLRNMNAPLFYAQALSLGEFILQHGGPRTLRSVTEDLARGRTLDEALRRASASAPGLPPSVQELEREWVRWLESSAGP
jgi:hypothetical protein